MNTLFLKMPAGLGAALLLATLQLASGCNGQENTQQRSGSEALAVGDTAKLSVMSTTDIHGYVRGWNYYRDEPDSGVGLTRVATLVDSIRGVHDNHLLLDAGDWLQGNPFAEYYASVDEDGRRYPFLEAVDLLGYDAVVLGNHEFDYDPAYLHRQLELTETPVISANIYRHDTREPAYTPYVMREVAGLRVAIIGLTTPGTAVWNRPRVQGEFEFADGVQAAERFTEKVREQEEADLVIILAHSGFEAGSSYSDQQVPEENFGEAVGRRVPGVDLLALGHAHRVIEDRVIEGAGGQQVGVIMPGQWGSHLGHARLEVVRKTQDRVEVAGVRTEALSTGQVPEHPELVDRLEPEHHSVADYYNEPVATTPDRWSAEQARRQDRPIIDLIHHVQLEQTGADLSVAAVFDTDAGFGPGEISRGDLSLLYPYENTLYTMKLDGNQLRDFLEYTSRYFLTVEDGAADADEIRTDPEWPGYNYDMIRGLEYTLDIRREPGERVTRMEYEGRPVSAGQEFTVAINSYRAEGGGGFDMLQQAEVLEVIDRSVRSMLIEYVEQEGEICHEDVHHENWELIYR